MHAERSHIPHPDIPDTLRPHPPILLPLTLHAQLHATQHAAPMPKHERLWPATAAVLRMGGEQHVAVLIQQAVV